MFVEESHPSSEKAAAGKKKKINNLTTHRQQTIWYYSFFPSFTFAYICTLLVFLAIWA